MPRRSNIDFAIGERIRARRLLRGWSIRYAASRTNLSHTSWSRIERGLQAADNRFVLADIAAALECTPTDLTGVLIPAADQRALTAHAGVPGLREALVCVDLSDSACSACPQIADVRRQLALVQDLRERCDYAGAVRLLPTLLQQCHALTHGTSRREGLLLLCRASCLASEVLRPLGHPAEAWLAAERCRDAAAAMGDPVMVAYAAYAQAAAAGGCGAFSHGLRIAEDAINISEPVSGIPGLFEIVGMLYLFASYASRTLNRSEDSKEHMAAAIKIAERVGEKRALGLFFGPTNANLWRITGEYYFSNPECALRIAAATSPDVIGVSMRVVQFHTDLAGAYAMLSGGGTVAVRHLITAERVAPQHVHTSRTVRKIARQLFERGLSKADVSALKGLCDRSGMALGS